MNKLDRISFNKIRSTDDRITYLLRAKEYEINRVFSSPKEMSNFISYIGRNYMYKAENLLTQFHFKEDSLALTTFDEWRNLGRQVRYGAKSIPTLVKTDNSYRIERVFDIEDTTKISSSDKTFKLWSYKENNLVSNSNIDEIFFEYNKNFEDTKFDTALYYFISRILDSRLEIKHFTVSKRYKDSIGKLDVEFIRNNFESIIDLSTEISSNILNKVAVKMKEYEIEERITEYNKFILENNVENIFIDNKENIIDINFNVEEINYTNNEELTKEVTKELDTNLISDFKEKVDSMNLYLSEEVEEDVNLNKNISKNNNKNYVIKEDLENLKPSERLNNNLEAIRTLKAIEKNILDVNPTTQEVLSKYVGWGGLSQVFDENATGQWKVANEELKSLLTEDEYNTAKESILTAYYTPKFVIDSIYKALNNFGFKSGKILEPSCGTGKFIGLLPESMKNSKVTGIELDSISGKIAKILYPESDIQVKGYEDTNLSNNYFDVAIGNVPFGNFKVFDKEYNKENLNIHDYFFAKTIDKVRPGGIIAFITSTGTLDKQNPKFREYMSERCEFVGAIRLPQDIFQKSAGTKTASDIIFLKKREELSLEEQNFIKVERNVVNDGYLGNPIVVLLNEYFKENKSCLLASPFKSSNPKVNIEWTNNNYLTKTFNKLLDEAISFNIKTIYTEKVNIIESEEIKNIEINKNFAYFIYNDEVYYREDNNAIKQDFTTEEIDKVKLYLELNDALLDVINIQKENCSDKELEEKQSVLNKKYEEFVDRFGNLSSRTNEKFFTDDSNFFLLSALELVDNEDRFKVVGKSDIFTTRTIRSESNISKVDSSKDALILSINNKAGIYFDYMSSLTGKNKEVLISELELSKDIYLNIDDYLVDVARNNVDLIYTYSSYVTKDEFLSGNLREKLDRIDTLIKYIEEVEDKEKTVYTDLIALKNKLEDYSKDLASALPKKLEASEIDFKIGANWIEPIHYKGFIEQVWNNKSSFVQYSKATSTWSITNKKTNQFQWIENQYGSNSKSALHLLEDCLNLKATKVYKTVLDDNGNEIRVLDEAETYFAQERQEVIRKAFKDYILRSPLLREKLTGKYNNMFNSTVNREYDGSNLNFSGMNPNIELRKHQKDAIARTLFGGNTLLAHVVGAGKTYEMVASIMESKRLGLANKSMMVVPNHLTEQIGKEFLTLYPSANILVATKKDFEPANRKKFTGRIATGNYDAIILGHTHFEKIPLSIERQMLYIEKEIRNLSKLQGFDDYSQKEVAKATKRLTVKLKKLTETKEKDDVLNFEYLGIDKLYVDEAHAFKNLFTLTKLSNIAGISQTEAMKSSDMLMKCEYMNEKTNYKGVVFATGTPISNTMIEMFTMQRYLQPQKLRQLGLDNFDDWIANFGEVKNTLELNPTGKGFRVQTRLASFSNIPELMTTFKEMADVKTSEDLNLPVPKARYNTILTKASDNQQEILETFVARAEAVKDRSVAPEVDNMLNITNDGKKLALDVRLLNENLPDDPNSKVNICVDNVFKIYEDTKENKSTQIIFCDMSTPNKDKFNVYDDIKDKLINKGIKEKEIAYIHNAKTELQKISLFEKVKKGEIRILMGSTAKMGTGTNVQDKLIALHDLDVPWRPSDLEQRAGRIIRQGNENKEVDIYRYVTENTFDSYLWQTIENKQRFISQIMTNKDIERVSRDLDEATLDYAEIKALATGNPLIKEKMQLDIDIKKLKMLESTHNQKIEKIKSELSMNYPERIKRLNKDIDSLEKDTQILESNKENNVFKVNGKEFTNLKEAEKNLVKFIKDVGIVKSRKVGEYKGFDVKVELNTATNFYDCSLVANKSYTFQMALSKDVNIDRMNDKLSEIPGILDNHKKTLKGVKTSFNIAKEEVNATFPFKDELEKATKRQIELNIILSENTKDKGVER